MKNKLIITMTCLTLISLISCENNKDLNTVNIEVTLPDNSIEIIEEDEIDSESSDTEIEESSSDSVDETDLVAYTNEDIMWLQESLKIAGYYTAMDGSFGSGTKKKLAEFKESVGLESNGEYTTEVKKLLVSIREKKLAPNFASDMVFINKDYYLPSSFVPDNLIEVNVRKNKSIELASHVSKKTEEMFADAEKDGLLIYLASGYRSYLYQEGIFSRRVSNYGFENAQTVVAIPGQSEHQTGLAIDITSEVMNFGLNQSFDEQPEFDWMMENCYKYGFILRYRKDKEDITKYIYEPWHYRYIGDVELAKYIMENELVLEEYFESIED